MMQMYWWNQHKSKLACRFYHPAEVETLVLTLWALTRIDAGVANVGVGEGDKLALVAGVSQNLLISCQGGVEDHFSH